MGNGDENALFYRVCSTLNLRCNGRFPRIRRHRTGGGGGRWGQAPAPIVNPIPSTFVTRNFCQKKLTPPSEGLLQY
jgi:hypothetical protein